jgi:SAM-dependent methyltransferase
LGWHDGIGRKASGLRAIGLRGAVTLCRQKLFGHTSGFLTAHPHLFAGSGLEVGGPSQVFARRGHAPVYELAGSLDNVNFAARTRWEGGITEGRTFRFREGAAPGLQLVHEASQLASVGTAAYDFLLSSHMLEHSANPLMVLYEWKRVLKPGGTLLLVLPHKDGSFDHRRPTTTLQHMVEDFERGTGEDDTTHFEEVLNLHDLVRDPAQASAESFRAWVAGNAVNRGVHQHVFDSLLAAQTVDAAGFRILAVEIAEPYSVFVFAAVPSPGEVPDNAAFTNGRAAFLRASPFRTDRLLARVR